MGVPCNHGIHPVDGGHNPAHILIGGSGAVDAQPGMGQHNDQIHTSGAHARNLPRDGGQDRLDLNPTGQMDMPPLHRLGRHGTGHADA